jgi:hypothetical protein
MRKKTKEESLQHYSTGEKGSGGRRLFDLARDSEDYHCTRTTCNPAINDAPTILVLHTIGDNYHGSEYYQRC